MNAPNLATVSVDYRLFRLVNSFAHRSVSLHHLGRLVAQDGVGLFAVLLVVAWWLARRSTARVHRVAQSVWAGASPLIAAAIALPISSLVDRPRPFVAHPGVFMLIRHAADAGFPSDHATVSGAVAAGLLLAHRPLGIAATFTAICIAFSRVYVGVHYPGDVAAGLVLGAFVSVIGAPLAIPQLEKLATRLLRTKLSPLISMSRNN